MTHSKNIIASIILFCFTCFLIQGSCFAQTANQIINTVNQHFKSVNDYHADVYIECKIPSVQIDPINARVVYKQPDKFKIKSSGILILPRQNVNFFLTTLSDTSKYIAVKSGEEMIGNVKAKIISVIPQIDTSDLILGKFWIDATRGIVLKSQLTTKSQGTILIENTYGTMAKYALPDKMIFTFEAQKFKLPKVLTMDIHSGEKEAAPAGDGKGRIFLSFSNYAVNKGVKEEELK